MCVHGSVGFDTDVSYVVTHPGWLVDSVVFSSVKLRFDTG